jgi:hypothetical protein
VVNGASTKVTKQLMHTGALQTLAKADKLTITVEHIDGGKLRARWTWDDAVRGPSTRGVDTLRSR